MNAQIRQIVCLSQKFSLPFREFMGRSASIFSQTLQTCSTAHSLTNNCLSFLTQGSLGIDALHTSWTALSGANRACLYAFPPPVLLDKVLQKLAAAPTPVVLIHPNWPSAVWWPTLLELGDSWLPLPSGTDSFNTGRSGCAHPFGHGFQGADKTEWSACWISGG